MRNFISGLKFWLLAILVFVLGVFYCIVPREHKVVLLEKEKAAELNKLREEKHRLEAMRREFEGIAAGDPHYIESEAHRNFKWRRPGEKIVKISVTEPGGVEGGGMEKTTVPAEATVVGTIEEAGPFFSRERKIKITVIIIALVCLVLLGLAVSLLLMRRPGTKAVAVAGKKNGNKDDNLNLLGVSGLLRG